MQTKEACLEGIRNQIANLEETIGRLVRLQRSLPEGSARNQLLEEISCLDVIRESIRIAESELSK